MLPDRRLRIALRGLAAALVAAWFLSDSVRSGVPFWVPFAVLLLAEAEFLVRGLLELRRGAAMSAEALAARRVPGDHDADLGWGEVVEETGEDGEPVVRWVPPPPRPPRRGGRALYLLGLGLAVVLLAVAYRADRSASWAAVSEPEQAAAEARFTREAVRIAGGPATVRCDDGYAYTGIGSDALGIAFPARRIAFLRPSVCRTLHDALRGDLPESDDAGEAVLVLAHEAVHLRGELREGVTECLALQEGVGLAERLGWPRDVAERLMQRRYEINRAERSITRITYELPAGCRDGGSLDRRPDDPVFP